MEDLQTRLKKISDTNTYRFKTSLVKDILEEFKNQMKKKNKFLEAVKIDQKHHPVNVTYEKIMNIIDEFIEKDKFVLKFTPNNIVDGYGNIAVAYDGNPYVTLRLMLMAFRTHNNIIFFTKKYYAINTKLVETLNMIVENKKYALRVASVEYDVIDGAIIQNQNFFNFMIFVGDKRTYQPLKKKISIPSIFSGYGNVDVFIENKSFKNLLLDINQFANENDVNINYYDNTLLEETLSFINKYELSDCFVLLSKNTDIIYKFISEIKSRNIYINRNPFDDYQLSISEKDLIYSKNIIMN